MRSDVRQAIRPVVTVTVAVVIAWLLLGTQQFANFLTLGAIYALIALGYTMVYGIIELINFAHGDVFMIGSLISIAIFGVFGINAASQPQGLALVGLMLVACLGSMLFCALLGVVIERSAYRPLVNPPPLAPLITAIGVSLILEDIGKLWKGVSNVSFPQ